MSDKPDITPFAVIGMIVGMPLVFIGLLLAAALLKGWVLYKVWAWLIVPTFPSAPHLTVVQAMGVSLMTHLLTQTTSPVKKDEDSKERMYRIIAFFFIVPFISLGLAFVLSFFVS